MQLFYMNKIRTVTLIFAILIISIYFIYILNVNTYDLDKLSNKQWYIYENYKGILESSENLEKDSFFAETSIYINSSCNLGVIDLWKRNCSKRKTIIALIDTAVDIYHEDLYNNIWINEDEIPFDNVDNDCNGYVDDYYGWNYVDDCGYVNLNCNIYEHGTHCAGIIVAEHNGIGVMGIAGSSDVKLMVLPALKNTKGKEDIENVIKAIKYAENSGADICNLSFSFTEYSSELEEVIRNSKMLFVVAAGNGNFALNGGIDLDRIKMYPASFNYGNVITVANLTDKMEIAYNSNYGKNTVDIGAPGEYIYSTLPDDNYGFMSGTSQAAPVVSGCLGMIYSYYKGDTLEESLNRIYSKSMKNRLLNSKIQEGRVIDLNNI